MFFSAYWAAEIANSECVFKTVTLQNFITLNSCNNLLSDEIVFFPISF